MQKYLGNFSVEELFDIKDIGVTMPVVCRINNGVSVVAKYMRNPFGQQVLINEFIGSCLADYFDLNIPPYGICNLSEDVIINTNMNEEIDKTNAGPCFFNEYYSQSVPVSKRFASTVKRGEVEKLVLFDHLICNHDRHKGNLLISNKPNNNEMIVIDHSHIFGSSSVYPLTKNSLLQETKINKILDGTVMRDNAELYKSLFNYVGFDEYELGIQARILEKVYSKVDFLNIFSLLPEAWTLNIKNDILTGIVELINARVEKIDRICEVIIQGRRFL